MSARQVGDSVVFRVTDDGPGIPKQDLERIFERFYQVERHRGQASTGLGLAICKLIVKKWGGKIWVDPHYTQGARFLFTHPLD